jgi:hypothetical protein
LSDERKITPDKVWKEYNQMLSYNESVDLFDTVRVNENFFVGKQWEGVESNGLPTPVFNFLKRVTLFTVASNTSDNIKLKASPLPAVGSDQDVVRAADVINAQFEALFEHNKIPQLMREYMRNAAVDGDAATYTYWDDTIDAGNGIKGGIVTEIVQNTRVGFGNTADRHVQTQPYILIKKRELTSMLKKRAKELGCKQWDEIQPDSEDYTQDWYKDTGNRTTVILRLWKDDKTKTVWACECCQGIMIREPWDLGLKLYPVTWLCWDYIQDNYHGQAMLTGLIPNQIYINKLFAMTMISLMTTAYPKIVYDKTRVPKWDNGIGKAIGVNGGDVNGVARILDPAQVSPQIAQFIELTQEMTQSNLGATSVALGDTRPDNTSAIIALQRAASTPNELTKQNLYQSIEELGAIYVDFMGEYYGERVVDVNVAEEISPEMLEFIGGILTRDGKLAVPFDFSVLKDMPMSLKLDVGASAYWSEIASTTTLDNLLATGQITIVEYLERLPDDYVNDRQGLLNAVRARMDAQQQLIAAANQASSPPSDAATPATGTDVSSLPVVGGAGNGELQRAVANGEMLAG